MTNNRSPFTQVHQERNGNRTPIVSMGAGHLLNTINLSLRKGMARREAEMRAVLYSGYAPIDMDKTQCRALGLRPMTADMAAKIEEKISEEMSDLFLRRLNEIQPYILVAVCRNDTREECVKLLQEVTGITGQVALPVINALELTDGDDIDLSDLEDPEHDYRPGLPQLRAGDYEQKS